MRVSLRVFVALFALASHICRSTHASVITDTRSSTRAHIVDSRRCTHASVVTGTRSPTHASMVAGAHSAPRVSLLAGARNPLTLASSQALMAPLASIVVGTCIPTHASLLVGMWIHWCKNHHRCSRPQSCELSLVLVAPLAEGSPWTLWALMHTHTCAFPSHKIVPFPPSPLHSGCQPGIVGALCSS